MKTRLNPLVRRPLGAVFCGLVLAWSITGSAVAALPNETTDLERLGRTLYFDPALSTPPGQSCASCHTPSAGFADPNHNLPVSRGVLPGRTGFRNAPTAAYAKFIPPLYYDADDETYVGGLFLDGRVNSLEEQAQMPLLNPLEMHNPDGAAVVAKVRKASYQSLFRKVFGAQALATNQEAAAYQQISQAIAAFERTPMFSPFTSKYDYYLQGRAHLTPAEQRGLRLFNGLANCFACHPSEAASGQPGPMFTDFTYDNIGIPKNWNDPYLKLSLDLNPDGPGFVDYGLANTVAQFDPEHAADQAGRFRVPTLRNLTLTAPYGHNGYFKTLKDIVHFYNTRDVPSAGWPAGEVPATVNHDELGDLGLTEGEENDLVEFLKTLTDGYRNVR
ncbi:MAG TPA: cytochrome c peroxidase [Verrucomicrobiae bacterium]